MKGRGLTLLPRRHRRRGTCRSRRRVDADHGGCRSFSESLLGEAMMREGDRGSGLCARWKGEGDRGSLVLTVKIGKGEGITEGMGGFQVNPAADARPVS